MDIRTKLVFALVSVALLSMLALGWSMYRRAEVELRARTVQQLEGLVEFKAESVEGIVAGWHDRVSLVASRTQLRLSLDAYNRTGSADARARIVRILEDAFSASQLFRELWVHDVRGTVIARSESSGGLSPIEIDVEVDPDAPEHDAFEDGTLYRGVSFREDGPATVHFTAPLSLDGETIGYLHAVIVADEIERLTTQFEGLGETGETMVVVHAPNGEIRALHPLRAAPSIRASRTSRGDVGAPAGLQQYRRSGAVVASDGPARASLIDDEILSTEGLRDYRGERVWAATRHVRETRWGLIVKIDTDELAAPITDFRNDTLRLAATLAAFAILIGTILGFRFAQPIHRMAEAANRIRAGEMHARSGISREDEVGLLAKTFDEMADSLEQQVELLSEFRRFFDMSLDMLCIASTDGYFKRVNTAFSRELGWSEDDLLRRPFMDLVHPDDVAATQHEIEKLAHGEPTIRFENRFLCVDGSFKRLRWNSFPEEGTGKLYAIARVHGSGPEGET